jgi:endonuclease YncB( thermonuclease family)
MRARGGMAWALVWLCLGTYACDRNAIAEAPVALAERAGADLPEGEHRAPPPEPRPEVEHEGLLIGEFRLAADPVVDGDGLRVEGIEGSIRLLSIDTEEPIRSKADRAAIERDFELYLRKKRGSAARPRKAGTPMGDRAAEFAEAFFEGVDVVRLERDDPKEMRGRYGRVLAYVFAKKEGRWTSYNVECVRAGMSPYFMKYGYSRRFHTQLARAETEARDAKRGIWDPAAKSYRDYDERKAWWTGRAELIRAFEQQASGRDDYVDLGHWDAEERLEERVGREATILGGIDRIKVVQGLALVTLSGHEEARFTLVFRDREVFRQSEVARYLGEPITAHGMVERYEKGNHRTLQIEVTHKEQVSLPSLPPPRETEPAAVR